MVENNMDRMECGDYVLQWSGHAGHVAERFSGFLAKQALVDVTLICEEQKLRVHKLVLACSSLYFEEILEQDLGEHPVIFLRDLNFNVLKAMIEFMYCGETTISQQYIPLLQNAAKNFKVKDLALILDEAIDGIESKEATETQLLDSAATDNESSVDSGHERDMELDTNHSETAEHNLYEDISNSESEEMEREEESPKPVTLKPSSIESQPILYEQCCEFPPNGFIQTATSKTEIFMADEEEEEEEAAAVEAEDEEEEEEEDNEGNFNPGQEIRVGKCLKVYTHKKRESKQNQLNSSKERNLPEKSMETNCIDLLEEPSSNNKVPLSLLQSLDIESADYILSLNKSEKTFDCNANDSNSILIKHNHTGKTPVLRRSLRISQQENENDSGIILSNGKPSGEHRTKNVRKMKYDSSTSNKRRSLRNNGTRKLIQTNKRRRKGSSEENLWDFNASSATSNLSSPFKLNTIATVNRSLWGDMSDILEDRENSLDFIEYTDSQEIPYAVGLLPLRVALEKMQATPDHQPRKTRSSVAPLLRHDNNNLYHKRKYECHRNNNKHPNSDHYQCRIEVNDNNEGIKLVSNSIIDVDVGNSSSRNRKRFTDSISHSVNHPLAHQQ